MGKRPHVARALHVVLAAQRVHAHAGPAQVPRGHGQVRHAHDHGRALAVLGDAEAVVDGGVAAGGVEPRGLSQRGRGHAGGRLDRLGGVARLGDERPPARERDAVAALGDEGLVHQALGDDHVGDGVDDRHVGAGPQGQVMARLDVRHAHEIDAARVDHDEPRAGAQPPLHLRGEDGVRVGRVGADHHHHVRVVDGVEVLGAGRRAEGGLEAVAGRRVAHARARVDVVAAEGGAHHLLDEERLLVRAARRGDAAEGSRPVRAADALELGGGVADGLVPRHLAPRVGDPGPDHRLEDAIAVGGVAPGEAALDAGMPVVGLAVLERHHADDVGALHLRLE